MKQLKAILDNPEYRLDESFQKETERIFHNYNAERQENQQKEIEMDIENTSDDDEDPNAQANQRRIHEELRSNFYSPSLKPSYLNIARHQLEKKKELWCRRLWLVVGNRERAPRF